MTKLCIITLLLFFVFSNGLKAQDADLFSFMAEHLTSEESSKIDRAKSSLKKADRLKSKINSEDKKNSKYFKKKKKKKAEKKSFVAKQLRIQQALDYEKAYSVIYNTYLDKINACSFYYPEDKMTVNKLIEDANMSVNSAESKIKSYKKKSKKSLKKSVSYSKLQGDLKSSYDKYVSGINNLIQAYTIYVDQEQKKQAEEEENRVWQNAESDNTIQSYQSYLNVYRKGKYSAEARRRIKDLEAKRLADANQKIKGNLIYRVQIAASRQPLPSWKLARIYRKTREITKKNYDDWHKYSVGSFKKYEQAKEFLSKIGVIGSFVVAYVDGEKIDIKRAIKGQ